MQTCDRMCRYCNNASGECPTTMAFTGTDFLVPSSELKQRLDSFASAIQSAVNPRENSIKTQSGGDKNV